mgnify:CR=1 FL=1
MFYIINIVEVRNMEGMKLKEASEYADRSVSWIRKKIFSGELEAKKESFKYGKRWIVTKKAIDDLLERATTEKTVEVVETTKPVNKEELLKTIESQNKELIDKAVDNVTNKIDKQNKAIRELSEQVNKLQEQQQKYQNQLQEEKNKSFIDKIKSIFN